MPGTTPDNWEWIRRKRNVVMRYHRSSYAIGLKHQRAGTTLESSGLDAKDYAAHGGCFPILLEGTGYVGTITVSGLPQREDHALVVSVLQEYLHLTGEEAGARPRCGIFDQRFHSEASTSEQKPKNPHTNPAYGAPSKKFKRRGIPRFARDDNGLWFLRKL